MKTWKVLVTLLECEGEEETPIAEVETEPTKHYAEAVESFETIAEEDVDDCLLDDDDDDAVIDVEATEVKE